MCENDNELIKINIQSNQNKFYIMLSNRRNREPYLFNIMANNLMTFFRIPQSALCHRSTFIKE